MKPIPQLWKIVLWSENNLLSATGVKMKRKKSLWSLNAWKPTPIGVVLLYLLWLSQEFSFGYFFHSGKEFQAVSDPLQINKQQF